MPGFKDNWAKAGGVALSLLVGFSGVGAFLSNYLTRNNRIDKIAVSLALAIALMKAPQRRAQEPALPDRTGCGERPVRHNP